MGIGVIYNKMQITYLSKASWFKIKTKNKVIHIDPGYTGYFETQNIPLEQLKEKADIILISHFHKDHLQPKALSMITDEKTVIFVPISCVNRIQNKVKIVKPNQKYIINNVTVKTIDAYNTSIGSSTRKVHHKGDNVGYLLSVEGKTIYHSGDTDFIPEMKNLGKVDIACLPIGGTFVMDIQEAVQATLTIKPIIAIPMHMSKANPDEFSKKVQEKSNIKVVVMKTGESFTPF